MKRRICRIALEIAALVVLFLGLVDLYLETRGLPRAFLEIARAEIGRRGVWLDCDRLQIGLVNGVRFRNVTVWDGQLPGTALLRVGDLRIRPELAPLLSGRFVISNFTLDDGRLRLPDPEQRPSRHPLLLLSDFRVRGGLRDGLLHVRSIAGMWNGVRINGAGTVQFPRARKQLHGPRTGGARQEQTTQTRTLSCLPLLEALRPEWKAVWRRACAGMRGYDFGGKARLEMRFGVPSTGIRAAKVRARLTLPPFPLGDARVRSLTVDCTWEDGELRVPSGRIEFENGMDASVEAGVFDPVRRTVAGRARARIRPELILQLLSRPAPPVLQALAMPSPAQLAVDLNPSPLDYRKLHGTFSLMADNARYQDLTFGGFRARGSCDDGRLRITEAVVDFGVGQDTENVRAVLSVELTDGTVHGQLSATFRPLRRLIEAGVGIGPVSTWIAPPGPLIEGTVQFDGRAWGPPRVGKGTGSFRIGPFTLGRRALESVSADVQFTPERIEISHFAAVIDRDTQQKITGGFVLLPQEKTMEAELSGKLDPRSVSAVLPKPPPAQLSALIDDLRFPRGVPGFTWRLAKTRWDRPPREWPQELNVTAAGFGFRDLTVDRLTLDIRGENGHFKVRPALTLAPAVSGGPVQQVDGELNLDLAAEQVSVAMRGRFDPGRIWKALRLKRNPIIERIELGADLPEMELTIRQAPLSPTQWRGSVDIRGGPGRFNGLDVLKLDGVLEFEPGKLRFRVRRAAARDAPDVAVVLSVDLARKQYGLTGRLVADPRIGAVFVGPKARDLYLRIWHDFTWTPGKWPEIQIDGLRWGRDPKTGRKRVRLDAALDMTSFRWRKLAIDSGSADITLDLPDAVTIRNIALRRGGDHAAGEIRFDFVDRKTCRISANATFNPNTDVPAVFPAADTLFRSVKFGPGSTMRVSGELPLARSGRGPDLAGVFTTPRLELGSKWPIADVRATWGLTKERLAISSFSGTTWGGTVTAAGQIRRQSRQASGSVTLSDLDAGTVFGDLGSRSDSKAHGKISGRVDFSRIEPAGKGKGLLFTGRGSARMTGADLWDVPLLKEIREFLHWTVPTWVTRLNPLNLVPGYSDLDPIERLWTLGRISKLETTLAFAGDHVQFEKITTDGDLLALTGRGRYFWKNGRIDLTVKAVPLEKTWLVPTVWKYVSWFFVDGARCTGTLKDHKWRPVGQIERVFPGETGGAGPPHGQGAETHGNRTAPEQQE